MDGSSRRGAPTSSSTMARALKGLVGLGCLAGAAEGIFYLPGVAPRSYEKGESVRAFWLVSGCACVVVSVE